MRPALNIYVVDALVYRVLARITSSLGLHNSFFSVSPNPLFGILARRDKPLGHQDGYGTSNLAERQSS